MLLSELPELINIIDEIILGEEKEVAFFSPDEEPKFIDMCLHLMYDFMDDNPTAISDPDFQEAMIENVKELLSMYTEFDFDNNILLNEDDEDDFDELIDVALELFYLHFIPPRSYLDTFHIHKSVAEKIAMARQITNLENKPQPQQRTPEWYDFRNNLITASNAYKAFENQSTQNQLIYEKCYSKQVGGNKSVSVTTPAPVPAPAHINVNSPLHWGQKFEPVSVMYYEDKYQTKVQDFGCIQHEKYSFIGASPDGIVTDPSLPNYGRMLEIKNPVSREIDGTPIKEYWIQMQLQMETCDLNECDFLETKFVEYDAESVFIEDGDFLTSSKGELKGIIMYFSNSDGNPHYVYKPLQMVQEYFEEVWEPMIMEENINKGYTWIKNICWRLEEVSCVLVLRNNKWFEDNIGALQDIWTTIEKERISGYAHRAPNKRVKKTEVFESVQGCLLNVNKESGKIEINLASVQASASAIPNFNNIVKIRTESFDETKLIYEVNAGSSNSGPGCGPRNKSSGVL